VKNKKLIIFAGGGDPYLAYKDVYDLLLEVANSRRYISVKIINWPGHFSFDTTSEMSLMNALPHAINILEDFEKGKVAYDLIGRSFGCSVFMKASEHLTLNYIRNVVLWGPPPYYILYKLFHLELDQNIENGYKKNVRISRNFLTETVPFETLLVNYQSPFAFRIATGKFDEYCKPFHLSYYRSINPNIDYRIVPTGHEVVEFNQKYINTLFDFKNELL